MTTAENLWRGRGSPLSDLFRRGARGALFNASSPASLFLGSGQPRAGYGDPVGLVSGSVAAIDAVQNDASKRPRLARSAGLYRGAELLPATGFNALLTGWSRDDAGGDVIATHQGGALLLLSLGARGGVTADLGVAVGRVCAVIEISALSGDVYAQLGTGSGASAQGALALGINEITLEGDGVDDLFLITTGGACEVVIERASVREILGSYDRTVLQGEGATLVADLPDLGAAATDITFGPYGIEIDDGQAIGAGPRTISADGWSQKLLIDRALSDDELREILRGAIEVTPVRHAARRSRLSEIMTGASAVCFYDTTKDADGGVWRYGLAAQDASWWSEVLGTADRGEGQEFPELALIVALPSVVTIYDATDPTLPMWMVFEPYSDADLLEYWRASRYVTGVSASSGVLAWSTAGASLSGVSFVDFSRDVFGRYASTQAYSGTGSGVVNRNTTQIVPVTIPALVSQGANAIAATALPDAPINPATGLPVPTIAAATDGGVSIINGPAGVDTVVNIVRAAAVKYGPITFRQDGAFVYGADAASGIGRYIHVLHELPAVDPPAEYYYRKGTSDEYYATYAHAAYTDLSLPLSENGGLDTYAMSGNAFGHDTRLTFMAPNPVAPESGMFAQVTGAYATGWMPGQISLTALSDSATSDLVGGTIADRSPHGNDLTVNGTITRTPVATGADLVAFGGFSDTNYIEQPYSADLDFGTGDFSLMGWIKWAGAVSSIILDRSNGVDNTSRINAYVQSTGILHMILGGSDVSNIGNVPAGVWSHICFARSGGVLRAYIDGQLVNSVASVCDVSGALSSRIGLNSDGTSPYNGHLALLRASATAPSAAQIAKVHTDERPLFQDGAQATLYGGSNAVVAVSRDEATGLVHAGTAAGRSVFRGLERVAARVEPVGTCLAVYGGLVASE